MLYLLLKILARLAIRIFCRRVVISKPGIVHTKGPVLLAVNHPNSFLDSVIIDTVFQQPVWSLARGDVFKKPLYIRLLRALKILPVYRTSEGVENLQENYKTFSDCIGLFRAKQIITIFSEGKCINEWHLRPLKKGTARLALKAWEEGIPLQVIPVGINYCSFRLFGKNVFLNIGEPILAADIPANEPDGARHLAFNVLLRQQLGQLVWEIDKTDTATQQQLLRIPVPAWKRVLLLIPAIAGYIVHAPLFLPIKSFTWKRTQDNDHYDSVMVALLLVLYPLYLLLITGLVFFFVRSWWTFSLLLFLPFCAWAFVQVKRQVD